jgi:transcriptional regulator with XRE-family HTH domain
MSEHRVESNKMSQDILQKELGARIVRLRKTRGWSQGELATRLRVHGSRLSKWERGVNAPSLEDLRNLMNVLEVTADELLTGTRESKGPLLPPAERTELAMYLAGLTKLLRPLLERPNGRSGR